MNRVHSTFHFVLPGLVSLLSQLSWLAVRSGYLLAWCRTVPVQGGRQLFFCEVFAGSRKVFERFCKSRRFDGVFFHAANSARLSRMRHGVKPCGVTL